MVDGIDAGDWLAFAGNIVGVVLAVAGASVIELYRRRSELHHAYAEIVEPLSTVQFTIHNLKTVRYFLEEKPRVRRLPADHERSMLRAMNRLGAALRRYRAARAVTRIGDFSALLILQDIEPRFDQLAMWHIQINDPTQNGSARYRLLKEIVLWREWDEINRQINELIQIIEFAPIGAEFLSKIAWHLRQFNRY